MSAYICPPEHIAALAAFAAGRRGEGILYQLRVNGNPLEGARNVAKVLMEENIRSVAARYPSDKSGDRPGPIGYTDEKLVEEAQELAERYYFAPQVLQPLDIYRMASSLDYQSCETEDYRSTVACRQIEYIKDAAIRCLPGFENAIRDYDGELHKDFVKGPKPVLLSSLARK